MSSKFSSLVTAPLSGGIVSGGIISRGILFLALICALSAAKSLRAQPPAEGESQAPDQFRVVMETTKGNVVIEVNRAWAPHGADRFHELVTSGFYDNAAFFRVVPGFVVQFGLNADPAVQKKWTDARIQDDPVVSTNKRGYVTFAMAGPNTRTTQMFINYGDNVRLDKLGFAPLGVVVEGMDVVEKINAEYGEKPNQGRITAAGNEYLKASFPNLDYITRATVIKTETNPRKAGKTE